LKIHARSHVLLGIKTHLRAVLELTTQKELKENDQKALKKETRSPFNLAVVLDHSGSMDDSNRIKFAKDAILEVLGNLIPEDRFHFIIYDDTAEKLIQDGKSTEDTKMRATVNNVRSAGGTNLLSGLLLGYEALMSSDVTYGKRIFLFSDGLVNGGIKDKPSIFQVVKAMQSNGVNITTFGIGDGFDEEVMKGIAEEGHGNYFFIGNSEEIPKKVESGMNILSKLIGSNITLQIVGMNGTIVTKVWGHDDLSIPAQLGDICENDSRLILLEADVTPPFDYVEGEDGEGKLIDIIKGTWTFRNTKGERIENKNNIQVRFTSDTKRVNEVDAVKVTTATSEGSEKDTKILSLLAQGDRKSAIQLKKETITNLQAVESLDKTGIVTKLIKRHEGTLADMEREDFNSQNVQRSLGYDIYRGRRLSIAGD